MKDNELLFYFQECHHYFNFLLKKLFGITEMLEVK